VYVWSQFVVQKLQKVTPVELLTLSRPTASTVCQATRSGIHARRVVEPGPVCRFRGQSDHVCAVAMHPIYTIAFSAPPQKFAKLAFINPQVKLEFLRDLADASHPLTDAVHWHLTLPHVRDSTDSDCMTGLAQ